FQNLVGNALKYHKASNAPFIEVGVKDAGSYWQFSVADNGIGISSEYFATIFVLFQRLHSKDEYPGTGMGLALSKKIIENAGGKIWVESTEGEGSKFYFTVKK
ncbi:MAG TPA: ATP-binding protein, partial [Chitinophagaceae bacterium]|nr:ATP-binding protein [Chitinophagaceae bacterium]